MSSYCDHYACPKDLLDRFLGALEEDDPREAVGELTDELYNQKKILHNEINFKWEDIHRCLTGDVTGNLNFNKGEYPLKLCIHGGEWLMGGPRTMTLVRADQLPDLCAALKPIDSDWLRDKMAGMARKVGRYANLDDEFVEIVWEEFDALRKFYEKAKKRKLPVICTISH
jgi:Domain of unknown function (DUF1877)